MSYEDHIVQHSESPASRQRLAQRRGFYMDDELMINLTLTIDECGFVIDFCDGDIGLDLAIKLSMARVDDKPSITVSLTSSELWRLIRTLTRRARYAASSDAQAWANELAMRLEKKAESESSCLVEES